MYIPNKNKPLEASLPTFINANKGDHFHIAPTFIICVMKKIMSTRNIHMAQQLLVTLNAKKKRKVIFGGICRKV